MRSFTTASGLTIPRTILEPGHDAARTLLDWAFSRTGCIRIDTHADNVIMHHVLRKYGFTRCGVIFLANGDPRDAYQMNNQAVGIIRTLYVN